MSGFFIGPKHVFKCSAKKTRSAIASNKESLKLLWIGLKSLTCRTSTSHRIRVIMNSRALNGNHSSTMIDSTGIRDFSKGLEK